LTAHWRMQLGKLAGAPRADAAAWALIENLPAHPMLSLSWRMQVSSYPFR
jgi:hypothetical protein